MCFHFSLSQKKVTHWQSCENLQYFHCIFYIFQTHQSTFYMFKINMLSKKHEKFSVIFLSFNFTLKGKIIILEKKYPIIFFNIFLFWEYFPVPSYFIWSVFNWSLTWDFCSRKQSFLSSTLCQKKKKKVRGKGIKQSCKNILYKF